LEEFKKQEEEAQLRQDILEKVKVLMGDRVLKLKLADERHEKGILTVQEKMK